MWWTNPRLKDFQCLFPDNLIDVVARAYAVCEVKGLSGFGSERGRNFERLFYSICDRRSIHLTEKAGSSSLAEQRSASGFKHEVDGATRSVECVTQWELKHLTTKLEKNELLIFNNKSLDYLQGSNQFYARIPLHRFLLSGNEVRDECRNFAILWGITMIEPGRLPLPLIYEAMSRGGVTCLTLPDQRAVNQLAPWSCRSLQSVVQELFRWSSGSKEVIPCGPLAIRYAKSAIDLQEQVGSSVLDYLDECFPDWIDEVAEETWEEVGGW